MEGGGKVPESLNEWEEIQSSNTQSREWEMVVVRDNNKRKKNRHHRGHDDLSIFPPSKHEGLQILPPDLKTTLTEPSSSNVVCDVKGEDRERSDSISRPTAMRKEIGNVLRSGLSRIANRVGCCLICRKFCSFASVTALLVAAGFLYSKLQRWRRPWLRRELERNNRLILLLKEKDETVSQLLLQIARMNEMLAARRKVPVIRVG